jgi:hypothetical protein
MQQPRPCPRRGFGERCNRAIVDRFCLPLIILREVDGGVRSCIDHPRRFKVRESLRYGGGVGNIQLRTRACNDLHSAGSSFHDGGRYLTAAEHQDLHANFSISAKEVPLASFAESLG